MPVFPHSLYISRCLELALNGSGNVAHNPMVGSIIVCDEKIIGEGYHEFFGQPHAEVNAINNAIENGNQSLLDKSFLYVNLEPCSHSGKTPPCTDLIIEHKIPNVIVGCNDPFPEVNGRGIKKLIAAGINVQTGILEKECLELNKRFITFHTKKRPYVILKFAQTVNKYISSLRKEDKKISNEITDVLVHKWRSEESAIMVGTKTAEIDNPFLTVRYWPGKNPLRVVIDKNLRLPVNLNVFDLSASTLIYNEFKNQKKDSLEYLKIDFSKNVIDRILTDLYDRKILSVMIEGGTNLLNQLIEENLWDEARIITADKIFTEGLKAPLINGNLKSSSKITGDLIEFVYPSNNW